MKPKRRHTHETPILPEVEINSACTLQPVVHILCDRVRAKRAHTNYYTVAEGAHSLSSRAGARGKYRECGSDSASGSSHSGRPELRLGLLGARSSERVFP